MKILLGPFLAVFCSFNVQAYQGFIENPYSPYPPGCATLPDFQWLYDETGPLEHPHDNQITFSQQTISLVNALDPTQELDVEVNGIRVGCADSNRSVIWLAFRVPLDTDPNARFWVPGVRARLGEDVLHPMSLVREPNSWDIGTDGTHELQSFGGVGDYENGHEKIWYFVLDNASPLAPYFGSEGLMSPEQYDGAFKLELNGGGDWDYGGYVIEVPSNPLDNNRFIPLSGRLSGNWVVDGASDQGFVIAISELVPDKVPAPYEIEDTPLLMFLSWFTYDADGEMLWLTGAAQYQMGNFRVTVPIEKVNHGEFMGSKTADREAAGTATITGGDCNSLILEYDLSDIGLGTGTERLQRRFSLEPAGYTCRDLPARIEAK